MVIQPPAQPWSGSTNVMVSRSDSSGALVGTPAGTQVSPPSVLRKISPVPWPCRPTAHPSRESGKVTSDNEPTVEGTLPESQCSPPSTVRRATGRVFVSDGPFDPGVNPTIHPCSPSGRKNAACKVAPVAVFGMQVELHVAPLSVLIATPPPTPVAIWASPLSVEASVMRPRLCRVVAVRTSVRS
jgi:hypothetical protein